MGSVVVSRSLSASTRRSSTWGTGTGPATGAGLGVRRFIEDTLGLLVDLLLLPVDLLVHEAFDQLLARVVEIDEMDPHAGGEPRSTGALPYPDDLSLTFQQGEVLPELELEVEVRAGRKRSPRLNEHSGRRDVVRRPR